MPVERPNRKSYLPPANYTTSSQKKEQLLKVLKTLSVPSGHASSTSRCVNVKNRKIYNLKSHDNRILMQDILPIALWASGSSKILGLLLICVLSLKHYALRFSIVMTKVGVTRTKF